MTTVYRNRALDDPGNHYTFMFANDKSGSVAYQSLPNVTLRVSRPDRYEALVEYSTRVSRYDTIRVTSLPRILPKLSASSADIVYEFHSSDERIIEREISELDLSLISKINTPSEFLAGVVRSKLPVEGRGLVEVLPNLVDEVTFAANGPVPAFNLEDNVVPLVWIGRLDKGKNASDFLRVLSLLPQHYTAIVILSFEDHPGRMAEFLGLAASLRVEDKIRIVLNMSQSQIAEIYRYARSRGGLFCSTSLGESFGYGVAEALSSGLSTVSYDVGALSELGPQGGKSRLIPVGDLHGFVDGILSEVRSG
ncbi:glycosyltransferase family 4 protein [Arthrobacter sp. zg-Y411]|uniref:glycosyltransferase family 4 protein n=1 Tax=Arthrobacter zhangbolii TaxID=2886936 RepID=UPI001D142B88|nr:glycosyltransferase family 4 protein [Arthrobacter zhangbolii]MCC3293009.1 glycosyltransferase family 4 protein [Arthrobacter zhangbolii]